MANFNSAEKTFLRACREGDVPKVQELLDNSKRLEESINSNIDNRDDVLACPEQLISEKAGAKGFTIACGSGQLDVVKYLIRIPGYSRLEGFKLACEYEKYDILEFMIFDFNMHLSAGVEEAFIEMNNKKAKEQVIEYFSMRKVKKDLAESLLSNLPSVSSNIIIKSSKI